MKDRRPYREVAEVLDRICVQYNLRPNRVRDIRLAIEIEKRISQKVNLLTKHIRP